MATFIITRQAYCNEIEQNVELELECIQPVGSAPNDFKLHDVNYYSCGRYDQCATVDKNGRCQVIRELFPYPRRKS